MKQVAVFFTKNFEEIEALTVVDLLRRVEIPTVMVSVTDERQVKGSHDIVVQMDKTIAEVALEDVEMLVLPGGAGTKTLEDCATLMAWLDEFNEQEKPIAAICAAPGILGRRGMLKGHVACSFPSVEGDLAGATIAKEPAVWDGHIITGRGMGCTIDFGLAIVAYLKGFGAAEELAEKIVFLKK
jgi:4-methyl-5(b-hydroxyethyl)-thiazole monophosphate biosynthesis